MGEIYIEEATCSECGEKGDPYIEGWEPQFLNDKIVWVCPSCMDGAD